MLNGSEKGVGVGKGGRESLILTRGRKTDGTWLCRDLSGLFKTPSDPTCNKDTRPRYFSLSSPCLRFFPRFRALVLSRFRDP